MLIGGVEQSQLAAQGTVPQTAENNKGAAQQAAQANGSIVEDFVEISTESKQKAQKTQDEKWDIVTLMEQMENARAQGKAMGDMITERIKCLQIAMRIMGGDNVPEEDMRFLAEKDPDLFARSIMMRKEKEDPEDCERISEDEEEEESSGVRGINARSSGVAAAKAAQPVGEAAPVEESGAASGEE